MHSANHQGTEADSSNNNRKEAFYFLFTLQDTVYLITEGEVIITFPYGNYTWLILKVPISSCPVIKYTSQAGAKGFRQDPALHPAPDLCLHALADLSVQCLSVSL